MFVFKKIYDKRKGECTLMITHVIIIKVLIAKRSDRQTEPIPGDDATVTHTDDPQEIINAHICFDLEDKPKQLLKALNSLMVSLHKLKSQTPIGREGAYRGYTLINVLIIILIDY